MRASTRAKIIPILVMPLAGCGSTSSSIGAASGTPPIIVGAARRRPDPKIDLLFMIDNSSSMADKQEILALAVPELVGRLVNRVDFEPVRDIHIGIITSSLGGHGASGICNPVDPTKTFAHNDDRGHLIARDTLDQPVTTFQDKGFLNWNPTGGGATTEAQIVMPFTTMVRGVGQHGCGYEAQLEAIYRFLIDPEPYDALMIDTSIGGLGRAVPQGADRALLQQRADFLRPDSIVVVVAMTDENDCSVIDFGQNFYVLEPPSGTPAKSVLFHGTSTCLTNPNDPCCFNCEQKAPDGCPDPAGDPECAKAQWLKTEDPENLRCFAQKQKYGVDFLWPISRYVSGLTLDQVPDREFETSGGALGKMVKNPLFSDISPGCVINRDCAPERDPTFVLFAGIVGVPWQDIARNPGDLGEGYLTAKEMADHDIWAKILGDPTTSPPVAPTDYHMFESVQPRAGLSPVGSTASADPINGHEWDTSKASPPNSDLQYACVYPLKTSRNCGNNPDDCDCGPPSTGSIEDLKNPLCQDVATNAYSTDQGRAKAYPSLRELQVLQGLGENAIVASICPANITDVDSPIFGYRPAIDAIVNRLSTSLRRPCLPRALAIDPQTKQVPCLLVEVFDPPSGAGCACDSYPGRATVAVNQLPSLTEYGSCLCAIDQLAGDALRVCQTEVIPPATTRPGWCYVDPAEGGSDECPVVQFCPKSDQRIFRFVNEPSEPRQGAVAFLVCDPATVVVSPPSICP
jgi:hypothetical protein